MNGKGTRCVPIQIDRLHSTTPTMASDDGHGDDDWDARHEPDIHVDDTLQRYPNSDDASDSDDMNDRQSRAVLGDQCPICLHDLDDPVMIVDCYHVYCCTCLQSWTRNLVLHGVRTPTCPLCKRTFDSAYADVVSETEYSLIYFGDNSTHSKRQRSQQEGLSCRAMVYRRRMKLARVSGIEIGDATLATVTPIKKTRREYAEWIHRELRASTGSDTDDTVLLSLIESEIGTPVKTKVNWDSLVHTLMPFLHEDTELFVRELAYFLASRLNMRAYDNVVEYCCSDADNCTFGTCSSCRL